MANLQIKPWNDQVRQTHRSNHELTRHGKLTDRIKEKTQQTNGAKFKKWNPVTLDSQTCKMNVEDTTDSNMMASVGVRQLIRDITLL